MPLAACRASSNVGEFVDPTRSYRGMSELRRLTARTPTRRTDARWVKASAPYTPWGEIAYQLAGKTGYEIVRRSDEDKIAPGTDTIRELFGSDPVLIVLDELGEYLRKVQHMGGRDQLTGFLKALFTAVEIDAQRRRRIHVGRPPRRKGDRRLRRGERVPFERHARIGERFGPQRRPISIRPRTTRPRRSSAGASSPALTTSPPRRSSTPTARCGPNTGSSVGEAGGRPTSRRGIPARPILSIRTCSTR